MGGGSLEVGVEGGGGGEGGGGEVLGGRRGGPQEREELRGDTERGERGNGGGAADLESRAAVSLGSDVPEFRRQETGGSCSSAAQGEKGPS